MLHLWILCGIIAFAFAFDFVNGFHDAANSIATVVSTRVLSPGLAVLWAAFFNFIAFLFFGLHVATTIGKGVVEPGSVTTYVIFSGLVGAIAWDLITWYAGIPTSSSHALVGGFAGAAVAQAGFKVFIVPGLLKIGVFIILAPIFGMIIAFPPRPVAHCVFIWPRGSASLLAPRTPLPVDHRCRFYPRSECHKVGHRRTGHLGLGLDHIRFCRYRRRDPGTYEPLGMVVGLRELQEPTGYSAAAPEVPEKPSPEARTMPHHAPQNPVDSGRPQRNNTGCHPEWVTIRRFRRAKKAPSRMRATHDARGLSSFLPDERLMALCWSGCFEKALGRLSGVQLQEVSR